jgi:predicted DCC family thiol-disulfide oxidoreductase YuxK
MLGWLLVAHALTPARPYGSLAAARNGVNTAWRLPVEIYASAFVVLAVSYSYSGYTKLSSPGWVSGDAIAEVLRNPLARDHVLRDGLLALPPVFLSALTWIVIAVELLFAPLALIRALRRWLWLAMLSIQFGFLLFLDFADLTAPMLLVHLLTFDPRWIKPEAPATLLYDGQCGFCHANIRLALIEDVSCRLRFASLQSRGRTDLASIVLIDDRGVEHVRSEAAIGVLRRLGGYWWLLAQGLRLVPRRWRDFAYDKVGGLRYFLGQRFAADSCPILPVELAWRLADKR